jgi:hypothetical protein
VSRCGKYLGDNDGTCPQLTCIRPAGHDGLCDNVSAAPDLPPSPPAASLLDEYVAGTCDRCRVKEYEPPGEARPYTPSGALAEGGGAGPRSWLCFRCYREVFGREAPGCAHDDPELDATDGAHPAWWRGNDYGVEACARGIEQALAHPIFHAGAEYGSETWGQAIRTVATMAINLGCLAVDLGAAGATRTSLIAQRDALAKANAELGLAHVEALAELEHAHEGTRLAREVADGIHRDYREANAHARFMAAGWKRLVRILDDMRSKQNRLIIDLENQRRAFETERDEARAARDEAREALIAARADVRKLRRCVVSLRAVARMALAEDLPASLVNSIRGSLAGSEPLRRTRRRG